MISAQNHVVIPINVGFEKSLPPIHVRIPFFVQFGWQDIEKESDT